MFLCHALMLRQQLDNSTMMDGYYCSIQFVKYYIYSIYNTML